jgi:enamine deaminase RidA (YjgF/YER057c/UK114 family)
MPPIQHVPASAGAPPLSAAARAGDMLYISGTPGYDDNRQLPDDFESQFGFVAKAIKQTLATAGADVSQLVKCNVLLTRASDVAAMNKLYAVAFGPGPYPARTTCVVRGLPDPKMLIEIEAVAWLGK